MNLELIRKYEKEFLHMLHGGELLFHSSHHGGWYNLLEDYQWDDSLEITEKCNDYGFVINDEYVEYRKALAEGRHIQFFNTKDSLYDSSKPLHTWQDIDKIYTQGRPSDYRIKPEEDKFKVGDYVRYIHTNSPKPLRIININCERYYFENAKIILRLDEIEKWEPREGEVCIFWNNDSNTAVIAKLRYIVSTGTYRTEHSYWENCMPFTGALPPHIKD